MTPAALIELADRVEGLEGATWEVDALIWCALNGKRYKGHGQAYGEQHLTQVEFTEPPRRTRCVSDGRRLPHALSWTASLDAAMSLVPEGYVTTISDWWMDGDDRPGQFADCADLARLKEGDESRLVQAWAHTKPNALLAAALRARAVEMEG